MNAKKIGIWMDHHQAHLTEFTADVMETTVINATSNGEKKINKSEQLAHNAEQHELASYYKKLSAVIRQYTSVLLFGPTQAKVELFNSLRKDHSFADIKITVINTDKMSENEQHSFVRNHFTKH